MGFCASPTAEMWPYTVEVRRESFVLGSEVTSGSLVELDTADIPALRAALDQVERIEAGEKA